ncbi:hypothetical protein JOC77_003031 [Peribacillus deserti]|uniref:Uncharacterized protein n=1 Tax=Peribacillus deserti TaxID=673318 RepID=A0ABS2QK79_9BACI|nr:hypothetical protein [Peribacillus deserti]
MKSITKNKKRIRYNCKLASGRLFLMAALTFIVDFGTMLMDRKVRDSCGENGSRETPQAYNAEEAPGPSSLRCNQQVRLTELINIQ